MLQDSRNSTREGGCAGDLVLGIQGADRMQSGAPFLFETDAREHEQEGGETGCNPVPSPPQKVIAGDKFGGSS
jgi:hypothetical protein